MSTQPIGRRLLIVGSGVSGLFAALQAVALGTEVTLVTKDALGTSNSALAQGGLSAVTAQGKAAGDSVQKHVHDTLSAGAGHCAPAPVQLMCELGDEIVARLEAYGVRFDRNADATLQLGLEAAHSRARIVHAGGDATGAGLVRALADASRALSVSGRLRLLEHTLATDVLLDQGRVHAVRAHNAGREDTLTCDALLLATGGLGQLYAATTNPSGATADGIGLAAAAGAVLTDMEFIQFHPTLVDPQYHPESGMISEAVRGEGAILLNDAGQRFMADHPQAELAPRDVVARAIHAEYADGRRVFLDARDIERERGTGFLARRFPTISARLAASSLDMARDLIPVRPAQHYAMGGIATDRQGRTTVAGLYAAGECANTGVHGSNRLASNSLLEALVFADRAVRAMAKDSAGMRADFSELAVTELPLPNAQGPLTLPDLQALASARLAVRRDGPGLSAAIGQLQAGSPLAGDLRSHFELRNLWLTARIIAHAAAQRAGNLGAHYRTDAVGDGGAGRRTGWMLTGAERAQLQNDPKGTLV